MRQVPIKRRKPPKVPLDESEILNATLVLSQTQILAQVTDEASLDGRNMGLLAFNGALLGGTLAAKDLLGHYWWTPLLAVGLSSVPCLWSAFKKTSAYGPRALKFFEEFGGQHSHAARSQLLADLGDAFEFNAARIRLKELRLQAALAILATGLSVAALLIAVVRPTTIRPCSPGQIRVLVQSHLRQFRCLSHQGSRSSALGEPSGAAANQAR
jgi:hypothetical protein